MEGAHERKRAKYSDLVAECRESGWSMKLCPVEVGTRGFVGSTTTHLLKDLGLRDKELHKATRELSEETEKVHFWLWLRRWDKIWGASNSCGWLAVGGDWETSEFTAPPPGDVPA